MAVASTIGRARAAGARVEVFYDIVSPYSYLLFETLVRFRDTWPATIVLRPSFLGGIMQASDNKPPASNPAKGKYMSLDLARQADYFGVPFAMPVHFPANTITVQRFLNAVDVHTELFRAYWARSLDVADVAVQRAALCPKVMDGALFDRLLADTKLDAIKKRLKDTSDEAVARGAFGAPTVFVTRSDETTPTMYFGADRLHLIARHLGVPVPTEFPARL